MELHLRRVSLIRRFEEMGEALRRALPAHNRGNGEGDKEEVVSFVIVVLQCALISAESLFVVADHRPVSIGV